MKKTGAIIQARMGSSRLPGKVLRDVGVKPLLVWLLERLQRCVALDEIVVATSRAPEDRQIVELCERLGQAVFRGSQQDVLDRMYQAARKYELRAAVRVTADCPLLDPALVDRMVGEFLAGQPLDYLGVGRTFPEGFGVEVVAFAALERAWKEADRLAEREHVTPFIWKNTGLFRVRRVELDEDLSHLRVTVDEPADLEVIERVAGELADSGGGFGFDEIVEFLKQHPEVAALNSHLVRDQSYWRSIAESDTKAVRKDLAPTRRER